MFESFFRRKEDQQRFATAGRLPPGQSVTQKFPVLHYGPVPRFNPATWDLRVWGEVDAEVRWSWDEFGIRLFCQGIGAFASLFRHLRTVGVACPATANGCGRTVG